MLAGSLARVVSSVLGRSYMNAPLLALIFVDTKRVKDKKYRHPQQAHTECWYGKQETDQ